MRVSIGLLTAVVSAALMSACGAATGAPNSSNQEDASGQIHGQVIRGPGVDPRSGGAAITPVPVSGDPVEVHDVHGVVVSKAVSAQDGTFVIKISAGTYTVVESICAIKKQVEVRSQAVTELTLNIPNSC